MSENPVDGRPRPDRRNPLGGPASRGDAPLLAALRIQNFALIEELSVEFGPGLTVLTGETGAGKSIIFGALQLIWGAGRHPS